VGVRLLIVQARRHLAQDEDHDLDDLKKNIHVINLPTVIIHYKDCMYDRLLRG
jgi:hypothetical protein